MTLRRLLPKKLHWKMLIGLGLGIGLGAWAHTWTTPDSIVSAVYSSALQPFGQLFLRLLFMVVVPMIFSGLTLGMFELGQSRLLGRIVGKTLGLTVTLSATSVLIGVFLVSILKPGLAFQVPTSLVAEQAGAVQKIQSNASAAKPFTQVLVELVPKNPLEAAVKAFEGEILSLMVFALFFGLALSFVPMSRAKGVTDVLDGIFQACLRIIDWVMPLAPFAVFAMVFGTAFKFGTDVFHSIAFFAGVVVLGLLIQSLVVYPLVLKSMTKVSPFSFLKSCRDVLIMAFSTASSNATLPRSLECAERELKLKPEVSRFVLTVGSTANQNGTALFEGVTVLFLAQVYGVDLSTAQQFQVVLMSVLAGIGTAGVPGGSLPLIMILTQQLGIPPEGMGIILGVDRFLDMCRTTVNVAGDLVIATAVDAAPPRKS